MNKKKTHQTNLHKYFTDKTISKYYALQLALSLIESHGINYATVMYKKLTERFLIKELSIVSESGNVEGVVQYDTKDFNEEELKVMDLENRLPIWDDYNE